MNTRMVVVGLVILLLGVGLFAFGVVGALGSISINRNFSQPHAGEYVSAEVVLNGTSDVVVASPAAAGGLVHAQDLGLVNSTNLGAYAVTPSTASGSYLYRSLTGDYYYVAFASTQPSSTIVATPVGSSLVRYGGVVLFGFLLLIVGVIVVIVGALRNRHPPPGQPA